MSPTKSPVVNSSSAQAPQDVKLPPDVFQHILDTFVFDAEPHQVYRGNSFQSDWDGRSAIARQALLGNVCRAYRAATEQQGLHLALSTKVARGKAFAYFAQQPKRASAVKHLYLFSVDSIGLQRALALFPSLVELELSGNVQSAGIGQAANAHKLVHKQLRTLAIRSELPELGEDMPIDWPLVKATATIWPTLSHLKLDASELIKRFNGRGGYELPVRAPDAAPIRLELDLSEGYGQETDDGVVAIFKTFRVEQFKTSLQSETFEANVFGAGQQPHLLALRAIDIPYKSLLTILRACPNIETLHSRGPVNGTIEDDFPVLRMGTKLKHVYYRATVSIATLERQLDDFAGLKTLRFDNRAQSKRVVNSATVDVAAPETRACVDAFAARGIQLGFS